MKRILFVKKMDNTQILLVANILFNVFMVKEFSEFNVQGVQLFQTTPENVNGTRRCIVATESFRLEAQQSPMFSANQRLKY